MLVTLKGRRQKAGADDSAPELALPPISNRAGMEKWAGLRSPLRVQSAKKPQRAGIGHA